MASFSFVRRYVQRHGRAEAFSTMLSTKSAAIQNKKRIMELNELDGLLPKSSTSPIDVLSNRIQKLNVNGIVDDVVLGRKTFDLLSRSPSPSSSEWDSDAASTVDTSKFEDLVKSNWLLDRMARLGITEPTPIQGLLLEKIKTTKVDLMIKSQTGTGKTFGYLLALLDRFRDLGPMEPQKTFEPVNMIIVPSSILADQLVSWTKNLLEKEDVQDVMRVILSEGDKISDAVVMQPGFAHIVVGTPKGLLTKYALGLLNLGKLKTIIIDEADCLVRPLSRHATEKEKENRKKHPMPALSFLQQLRGEFLAKHRSPPRVIGLSASLSGSTRSQLRSSGLVDSDALFIEDLNEIGEAPLQVTHHFRLLSTKGSDEELAQLIMQIAERHEGQRGIIFTRAGKSKVEMMNLVRSIGIESKLLSETKEGGLLIASDVDARGIDLPDLSFVIHAEKPESTVSYLHVAGRVGRMSQAGNVYTILRSPSDHEQFLGFLSRLGVKATPFINYK